MLAGNLGYSTALSNTAKNIVEGSRYLRRIRL